MDNFPRHQTDSSTKFVDEDSLRFHLSLFTLFDQGKVICYKVVFCVFQGSGKTYTIGGGNVSPVTEDEDGIIPRAVRQMFDIINVSTTALLHWWIIMFCKKCQTKAHICTLKSEYCIHTYNVAYIVVLVSHDHLAQVFVEQG